jgi:hypothetical protein
MDTNSERRSCNRRDMLCFVTHTNVGVSNNVVGESMNEDLKNVLVIGGSVLAVIMFLMFCGALIMVMLP